jgi:putative transposase
MKCPAEVYQPSPRPYTGLQDIDYPLHDKTIVVTRCGRICLGKGKINFSQVFAGQAVGIKEVHDGIWLVSSVAHGTFRMHSCFVVRDRRLM